MKTKKLFPAFLCTMSIALFASCDKLKDASVSEQKSIKIEVETEVKEGVVTYSLLRTGEVNIFSGTANVSLSDLPELKGFDLSALSSVTVTNVTVGTSCTEKGDYYAENIQLQSTGASATVSSVVIGESVSNNSEVNTFVQTVLTNLVKGNTVPISISGTTNLKPSGKKIIYTLNIDAKWTSDIF